MGSRLVVNGLTEDNLQVVIVFPSDEEITTICRETELISNENVKLNYYFLRGEDKNGKRKQRRRRKKDK